MKVTVELTPGAPITEMDAADLEKREGMIDNEIERTTWVEYWIPGTTDRPVHRSVHVTLKTMPALFAQVGEIS